MDIFTTFTKDLAHMDVKFSRKIFRGHTLWVMFNLSVTAFDFYAMTSSPTTMAACSFGAMLVTSLWSLVFLLESWKDLRDDKQRHNFLIELNEKQLASSELRSAMSAKQSYEKAMESLEKNNDKGS